ncbi:thyroid hormone-inducible hepatic protein [Platysternon megacephalum]|uniref:Thyroid hormone-inducible hepatic protein n=1 Tax=Platysternon megacephalum TaxID=55544 RepID=A0A4D9F8Q4_9SAUR|nr:thyroid hormone-inducible hepatic protein [Platysternon megacephalum]
MFSVRIVTADYYMGSPLPGLDPGQSCFREAQAKKVPVVRVFGATPAGPSTSTRQTHGTRNLGVRTNLARAKRKRVWDRLMREQLDKTNWEVEFQKNQKECQIDKMHKGWKERQNLYSMRRNWRTDS